MSKITYSVSDGVAVLELNDPPANTYSYEMMRELDEADPRRPAWTRRCT